MLTKVAAHFPHGEVIEVPQGSHLILEDEPRLVIHETKSFLEEGLMPHSNAALKADSNVVSKSAQHGASVLVDRFSQIAAKDGTALGAVEASAQAGGKPCFTRINRTELSEQITRYARGIQSLGLRPGDKVLMLVPPGFEFLQLTYAVLSLGATPIFIDPGISKEHLFACLNDIQPDCLIGAPKAHILRLIAPKCFRSLKCSIVASKIPMPGARSLRYLQSFSCQGLETASRQSETEFIAFTSGATGKPKGVVFTSTMIEEQLKIFSSRLGLVDGGIDLPLLPIFSLFHIHLVLPRSLPLLTPANHWS